MTAESPYQEYRRIVSNGSRTDKACSRKPDEGSCVKIQEDLLDVLSRAQRSVVKSAILISLLSDALVQQGKPTKIVIEGKRKPE